MSIVAFVATIVIMAGGVTPGLSPRVAAPVPPAPPIVHELVVEPLYSGGEIVVEGAVPTNPCLDLDRRRIAYIMATLERLKAEEAAAVERARKVAWLDNYLASRGSPLTGYAEAFLSAQERTGVSAALMVGLVAKESTFGSNGSLSRTHHNAFGMKWNGRVAAANVNGWCWWPDWSAGINGAADFIIAWWGQSQTAYDLRGYCEGNPSSWVSTVESIRGTVLGGFGGGGSSAE